MEPTRGRLVLVATPIGLHTYANPALRKALSATDMIAVEDAHHLATLLRRIDVATATRVLSYFGGNEAAHTAELTGAMTDGQDVVLVTDVDMPSVSDPGHRLVAACVGHDLPVTAVPGLSAVLTALTVSGLPCNRFCSEGFLPRETGERHARLARLTAEERIIISFEAPHRLYEWLLDAADTFGADQRAVVCRELAKPHEGVVRDDLAELVEWAADGMRDEVTIATVGAEPVWAGISDVLELVASRVVDDEKLSQAVCIIADLFGVPRKELYEAALAAGKKKQ